MPFVLVINFKMPTIVGISKFMNRTNIELVKVEHFKGSIRPGNNHILTVVLRNILTWRNHFRFPARSVVRLNVLYWFQRCNGSTLGVGQRASFELLLFV